MAYALVKETIFATAKDKSGNTFDIGFLNGYVYSVYPDGYCYKLLGSTWFPRLDVAILDCQSGLWDETFSDFELSPHPMRSLNH